MHYGDKEQEKNQKLSVIVYKHGIMSDNPEDFDLEISSIQECRYVDPYALSKLIRKPNKRLGKSFEKLDFENFYLAELKWTWETKWEVLSVRKASHEENPYFWLH
jgi:hypothetical protein